MTRNGIGARRRASARSGFRNWRRTRPFWGGLLVALGGVVILLAPLAPLPLIITQGIAGVSGYLVGLLLIAIGVLSWIQPPQRMFFGVVAILLSLASFVTSNFGGFLLGMLLGLIGGSMLFAWMPEREPRGRRAADGPAGPDSPETEEETPGTEEIPSTSTPEDEIGTSLHPEEEDTANQREEKQQPDNDPPAGGKHSGVGGLAHASVALPLALTLTLPAATAPTDLWDDWFGSGDEESSESTPSPTPSESGSAEPSPDESPTDGEDGGDGDSDSGDGSEEGDSGGDSEDGSDDSEDSDGNDEGSDNPDEGGDANPEECQFEQGESSQAKSEEEFLDALKDCQAAKENNESPDVESEDSDGRFTAGTAQTGLSADSLTMEGASFDGVVEYPTTDGPKRYLKLSMDKANFEGARQWFEHSNSTAALDIPAMTMSGDVEMHVTRMEARILGIKLTFTPDFPPPLLLPHMTVTDLKVDQPLADANTININGLNEHASV